MASLRIALWLFSWLAGTWCIVSSLINESRASDDPSAMAWIGFLPYFLPLFFVQSALYVAPVAIITEIALWFRRRIKRKNQRVH